MVAATFTILNCSAQISSVSGKSVSTSDAINDTLRYIYNNIDCGYCVISVFLEFAEVFDSVDNEILLQKMSMHGMRGGALDLFCSCWTQQPQYVYINDMTKGKCLIAYVVSQRSILGPLLFLIFINDFPTSSKFFISKLFADNSTLSSNFGNTSPQENSHLLKTNLKDVYTGPK